MKSSLVTLGCIMAFALIASCMNAGKSGNSGPSIPTIGQVRIIGSAGSGDGMPCPLKMEGIDALQRAEEAKDDVGWREAMLNADTLFIGDKVRIIDMQGLRFELRVLSGPFKNDACWAEGDMDGLFR